LTDIGIAGSVTGMTTPTQTARESFNAKNTIARTVPLADVAVGDWVHDAKRATAQLLAEVTEVERRTVTLTGREIIVLHIRRDWPSSSEPDQITGQPTVSIWCQKEVTA
jgi:hypothetical protein